VKPINTLKVQVEKMKKFKDRIPDEVLKEIFPKKLKRSLASELVYTQLKEMVLSGRLKKGQNLIQEDIAHTFNVSKTAVSIAYSRLKKEKLIIIKGKAGLSVA
jgi:DNA-binding GntR family transcriptional regulator